MRLTCPNCAAQYEVPDEVIPFEGRDVQCSNCGNTWYFYHPDNAPAPTDESMEIDPDEEIIRTDETPHDPPQASDVHEDDDEDPAATAHDEATPDTPEPYYETETSEAPLDDDGRDPEYAEAPPSRPLDPTVADILREEAELEMTARQHAMGATMESQPDLGLDAVAADDESDRRAREASERMARMRGEDSQGDGSAAAHSRRDLLPDIEEINSTLRSSDDRGIDDPAELANLEVREKRSFLNGFSLIILLVAAMAVLYTFAPQIAQSVPATEGIMTAYVEFINSLRVWLDAQLTSLLTWIDEAATSASN